MAQSTSRNDSSGGWPDRPRETGGAPLSGRVVLLPRLKERDRIASALERAGAKVLRASMTRTVPGEAAALEATARRIVAGEAAWLVLTSARTVEALAPYLHVPVPLTLRVAVVGPATARAWTDLAGTAPDLVARGSAAALLKEPALAGGPASGEHAPYQEPDISSTHHGTRSPHTPARSPESMTDLRDLPGGVTSPHDSGGRAHASDDSPAQPRTVPEAARRVLLPASELADPALADGLRRAGWEVEQVAAYTTVTANARDLPPNLECMWVAGGVDAVVLTAPSSTRAILDLLGPPPQRTGLAAIGATTAAAARGLGLTVAAVAPSPTPEGVLQATIDAIQATTSPAPAPQEPP